MMKSALLIIALVFSSQGCAKEQPTYPVRNKLHNAIDPIVGEEYIWANEDQSIHVHLRFVAGMQQMTITDFRVNEAVPVTNFTNKDSPFFVEVTQSTILPLKGLFRATFVPVTEDMYCFVAERYDLQLTHSITREESTIHGHVYGHCPI